MASKKIKTIKDIYEAGDGTMQLAVKLDLTQAAVEAWGIYGIPRKHWAMLTDKIGIPLEDLFRIDEELRNEKSKD